MTFDVDPPRTALVIVDMQYYFVAPGRGVTGAVDRLAPGSGTYYFERIGGVVVPALRRLLAFFRERGLRVVYVVYASREPDGSDLLPIIRARNAQRMAQVGAPSVYHVDHPEARVLDEIAPLPGERVIVKTSAGAFNSTNIETVLRNWGIETVVVTGGGTSGCVDLTARDASDRGFQAVLVDDACATWNEVNHRSTLRIFAGQFGRVLMADDLIAELTARLAAPAT